MPVYQMVPALLLTFGAVLVAGAGIMQNRYEGVADCSGTAVPWMEMFPAVVSTSSPKLKNCLPAVPQKALTDKETNAKATYKHICSGSDNTMTQEFGYMNEDCTGSAAGSNTLADKAGWCRQLKGECVKGTILGVPAGKPVSFKLSAAMPATDWIKCCAEFAPTTTTQETTITTSGATEMRPVFYLTASVAVLTMFQTYLF